MSPSETWCVMPWLNGVEMTWQAVEDCLAQTVPCRVLLVGQGVGLNERQAIEERIDARGDSRVLHWNCLPALPSLSTLWNRALDFVWELGGTEALVVNNDVRLHPVTVGSLRLNQQRTDALFVSAIGVREAQFKQWQAEGDQYADQTTSGIPMNDRGGPDFSCFLITRDCHLHHRFDERFVPAYHEDLDYHRRLMLAGEGHRIFGMNLPFLHYASGSTKAMEGAERERFDRKFLACRDYYRAKWGGGPNEETFWSPFDQGGTYSTAGYPSPTTPNLQRWWQAHPQGLPRQTVTERLAALGRLSLEDVARNPDILDPRD